MEMILWIVVLYLLFVRKPAGTTTSGGGTSTGPASEAALYGAYISNDDLNAYNSASPTVDGSWGDGLGFDISNAFNNGNTTTQNNKQTIFRGPDMQPIGKRYW